MSPHAEYVKEQVTAFAQSHGLRVLESNQGHPSVVVSGTVAAINKALDVTFQDDDSPSGKYRGHEGSVGLPHALADIVEPVSGPDDRQVPARHCPARHRPAGARAAKRQSADAATGCTTLFLLGRERRGPDHRHL